MDSADPLVRFETDNSITVGTIQGTTVLDGLNVESFGACVLAYLKDRTRIQLLINFENINYISSSALTELLRINQALEESQGAIRLCRLTCDIRKVFQITNLDRLLGVDDSVDVQTATQQFEKSLAAGAGSDVWAGQDSGS